MRDVHERRARARLDLLELELHLLAQLEVERAERLVEQQRGGLVDERARERDALLLAAGELPGLALLHALEAHRAQRRATRVRTSSRLTRFTRSPNATFSNTLMCGNSAYDWNTMLTCRLAGGTCVTSPPRSRMRPLVGSSKPAIMRSVVVLPQPDGPSIEKNSPSWISNETSSTATTSSKRFVTDSRTIASVAAALGSARGQAATIDALPARAPADAERRGSASAPASENAVASFASSRHAAGHDRADERADAPADREQPHRDALADAGALGAVGRERIGGREADRLRDADTRPSRRRTRAVPSGSAMAPSAGRQQQRAEADELEPVEPVGDARDRERRDRARDRDEP